MRATHQTWKCSLLLSAVLAGCGGNGNAGGGAADMALDPCSRGTVESDLKVTPWQGPGVDASGNLTTGQYVVSSTYLRFKPDATAEFVELFTPITTRLRMPTTGLVAMRFGFSAACNSGRTLSVWADQASMVSFVTGPEHSAAAARVGDISRGGGAVIDFTDDGSGATFANAASQLAGVSSQF